MRRKDKRYVVTMNEMLTFLALSFAVGVIVGVVYASVMYAW